MSSHYSEDELARCAAGTASASERTAIEKHVGSCEECRATLEAIRAVDEALADEDTWLLTGLESTANDLDDRTSKLLEEAIAEDEEAAELLGRIIATPAAVAYADLPRKRRYHTAGVGRFLCRAARDLLEKNPPDALLLADNAIAVAEALDQRYPPAMRSALIGTAWKERANALRIMGDYTAAESAFDHAERAYRSTPYAESELARIQFGRATVYEKKEQLDRAMELALESAATFERLGDPRRRIGALMIVGGVQQKRFLFAEARKTFLDLIPAAEAVRNNVLVAALRSNAGWAAVEERLFQDAEADFQAALAVFLERGMSTHVVIVRWGLAHLLLLKGELHEAIGNLSSVLEEAIRLEMHITAALIVIDIVEALTGLERFADVPHLCRYAISVFRRAGRADSLLTAFGYLKEASRSGRVPRETISYLRRFFRRLENEPNLLFVAPPPFP
jgi:tetratricopeptide (TPR) repeat protein